MAEGRVLAEFPSPISGAALVAFLHAQPTMRDCVVEVAGQGRTKRLVVREVDWRVAFKAATDDDDDGSMFENVPVVNTT